jgi:transcriptional regulator with XRE-family HTH domain
VDAELTPQASEPGFAALVAEFPVDEQPEVRRIIGKYLGETRRKQNKDQEAAARAIGISRPHLSNIEVGRSRPSWEGIDRMRREYGLGVQELIDTARERRLLSISMQPVVTTGKRIMADPNQQIAAQTFASYNGSNLNDYEKLVMSAFHVLDSHTRSRLIEQIRAEIQGCLQPPNPT